VTSHITTVLSLPCRCAMYQCKAKLVTWWQGIVALMHDDGAMVCHDVGSSPCWHAQGPVGTDGEAALPLWQVCLEVALELVGWLIVGALPLQNAILPSAPQAASLCVPVHSLHYQASFVTRRCNF